MRKGFFDGRFPAGREKASALAGVNPVTGGANRSFTAGGKVTLLSANASYTIDIGAREVAVGDKLVEWDAMPAESVEFAFAATGAAQTLEERELALAVRDDGLYVKSTKVPYARWDLNAETPGWRFYYPNGVEAVDWRAGVTSEVEVRFVSYDEYVAAKAQHVNPAAYVLMGTFVVPEELDELDLSECFDRFAEDATLDLRGKRVTVLKLSGFGTVTDTTADAEHPGELHVVVPEDARMENSVVAITGNIRLIKDGLGELAGQRIVPCHREHQRYARRRQQGQLHDMRVQLQACRNDAHRGRGRLGLQFGQRHLRVAGTDWRFACHGVELLVRTDFRHHGSRHERPHALFRRLRLFLFEKHRHFRRWNGCVFIRFA